MNAFSYRFLALLLALTAPVASAQVFKWVDENGRVHYGEKPPPGAKASAIKPPAATPNAPAAKPQDVRSQELDFRDRQRKKEEDAALQAQDAAKRAAACSEAKERLALAEQARLYRREKGERVFFSDAEQTAETEARRAAVTRYCR